MAGELPKDVTLLLESIRDGDQRAERRLFELMYQELRRLAGFLMAREPPGHTLQATALVNQVYLKLVGGEQVDWSNRRHFIDTVARAMRHILVDRARRYASKKHGSDHKRIDLAQISPGVAASFPMERMEELERAVSRLEGFKARWGEIVHMRFFAGLTIEQTAEVMEISPALVKKDWKFARAWLLSTLDGEGETD